MSTYESLLRHYKITDPKLIYIGKIIHDIEVNVWEKKVFKESWGIQDTVNRIIMNASDNRDVIERSIVYFDKLCKSIH